MEYLDTVSGLVSTLGFPIVCVGVLFFMIYRMYKDNNAQTDKWMTIINNNTTAIEKLAERLDK
jgi:hypothetical protein